jgi:hypothetical protein
VVASEEQRVGRNPDEFLRALRDQRELLRNAAARYDAGSEAEAKNLAVRLRVLLHDGKGRGASLLGQLGVKDRLPYLDTALAEHPPEAPMLHGGLCMIRANLGPNATSRYVAPLDRLSEDRQHPPQAFVDWWLYEVVTDDSSRPISRADFVLWLANQDGGAHIDASLDAEYAGLSRRGVSSFQPIAGDDPRLKDLAAPSVRQIAYEFERTLDEQLIEDPSTRLGVAIRDPICSLSIHDNPDAGRNDPCPCGSGLKLKRCFGLRQPRKRRTLDELLAETG